MFRDVTEEEAVQRLLSDFLSNVTHEFRTPLTALAASVDPRPGGGAIFWITIPPVEGT